MNQFVTQLKEAGEDYEYYPTTSEIIKIISEDIEIEHFSILDIGAGNGNALSLLQNMKPESSITKYAIEKSKILVENMPPEIFVIGTDFNSQTLIDKKVDIIFCNPPYSEFSLWTKKIITESNCKTIYMVIPDRWQKDKELLEIIKKRKMSYEVIGSADFIDSEYRQARAKVDIIRIGEKIVEHSGRYYHTQIKDPFEIWFDSFFNIQAEDDSLSSREKDKKEEIHNSLIKGQNLIERLEDLYNKDFDHLLNNYRSLENLDPALLKELQVNLSGLKSGLKMKISGLKNLYWQELFDNLDTITSKLTKDSREKLLSKLTSNTSVDFTSENAYAVVIWAIKNANLYMDQQLKDVYLWMTRPENLKNFKSNDRMISDDWRYAKDHTHYSLDYRLVFICWNNFTTSTFGLYDFPKGLNKNTHDKINDIITIGKNLGFNVDETSFQFDWEAGKPFKFHCKDGEIFMEIRAYKNGNIHCKANQKFIKKLNIEAARLNGWIKSPEEAAREMDIPIDEVKGFYGGNLQISMNKSMLLIGN